MWENGHWIVVNVKQYLNLKVMGKGWLMVDMWKLRKIEGKKLRRSILVQDITNFMHFFKGGRVKSWNIHVFEI
jgi:hypothetical protein